MFLLPTCFSAGRYENQSRSQKFFEGGIFKIFVWKKLWGDFWDFYSRTLANWRNFSVLKGIFHPIHPLATRLMRINFHFDKSILYASLRAFGMIIWKRRIEGKLKWVFKDVFMDCLSIYAILQFLYGTRFTKVKRKGCKTITMCHLTVKKHSFRPYPFALLNN